MRTTSSPHMAYIDAAVAQGLAVLTAPTVTNAELLAAARPFIDATPQLARFDISPESVAKSASRIGLTPWRTAKVRGWFRC